MMIRQRATPFVGLSFRLKPNGIRCAASTSDICWLSKTRIPQAAQRRIRVELFSESLGQKNLPRRPELTMLLRVLADRRPLPCRFIVLGSASPDLIRQASDSLAGRIHFVDMSGFTLDEVGHERRDQLWLRGGFPQSFLSENDEDSRQWRLSFVRTFLERDMPQMGVQIPAEVLRRFWTNDTAA